jgi:hypothetical protein
MWFDERLFLGCELLCSIAGERWNISMGRARDRFARRAKKKEAFLKFSAAQASLHHSDGCAMVFLLEQLKTANRTPLYRSALFHRFRGGEQAVLWKR